MAGVERPCGCVMTVGLLVKRSDRKRRTSSIGRRTLASIRFITGGKGMIPERRSSLLWMPWAVLAMVGAAYGAALFREVSLGIWRPFFPPVPAVSLLVQLLLMGLGFLALVLGIAVVEAEAVRGALPARLRRLLRWTPRVALAAFALFTGVFALDVIGDGRGLWQSALDFVMHGLPTTLPLLLLVLIAWRWPLAGAIAILGWVVLAAAMFWESLFASLSAGLAMLIVPFAVAVLLLLNWRYRAALQDAGPRLRPSYGLAAHSGPVRRDHLE